MDIDNPLVVAISSRALFDLDASHAVYDSAGVEAFSRYQIEHEDEALAPGVAFPLVKKLLALNGDGGTRVEIVLVSRNSGDSGLRVMHSIREHGLDIVRAVFTNGEPPYRYIPALGAQLFLSANPADVRAALDAGHAAATILPSQHSPNGSGQLRLAFDGDAVLFSDEAERVYQQHGLAAWQQHEHLHADKPLPGGPFKPFLDLLAHIQRQFPADANPIRTALVTARGAPAHERVIKTLRSWNVRIDEALFLGGRPKGPFLAAFGADLFFDDQMHNCATACEHVPTGHVPSGVVNE
ncbi:5'-nucleotidase [Chitinivorax sp. PXF-14]|uniref:5'-nucleotidase n=1 Tax=Chitinivorax sp. PXF-14 TaxID=3230488 RepID=UPI003467DE6F